MVQAKKQFKECHTSFDIVKQTILSKLFSKVKLSPSAKLVLWCLVVHWNHRTGIAFPKQSTIAEETGLTKASVNKGIEELRNAKFILTVKNNCRLSYQLTNVLLNALNESEEPSPADKNNLQEDKNICPVRNIKNVSSMVTNKFQQIKEQRSYEHKGLRGTNSVKPILEQYERDKQMAVSPFDDFECAVDVLKRILKPETQQHAFARKMFRDIQAKWHLDDSVIEQIKKGETPNGKLRIINS